MVFHQLRVAEVMRLLSRLEQHSAWGGRTAAAGDLCRGTAADGLRGERAIICSTTGRAPFPLSSFSETRAPFPRSLRLVFF